MTATKAKPISAEEGVVYVSTLGVFYGSGETVTAEKLKRLRKNIYGRGLINKLKNHVFERITEAYIEVLDKNNNPAEKVQLQVNKVFDRVDIRSVLMQAWEEAVWYGVGIFNPVWARQDNEIVLKEIRHLPTWTFSKLPEGYKEYCDILKGIVYNEKTGQVEYWQYDPATNGIPFKLDSSALFVAKDPSSLELGGDPLIRPIVPVLEMLSYTWDTEMQRINRVGAPIMFIKITKPQGACDKNGNVGDIDYANRILQHWGKNNAYPLRENMEIVWPDFKDSTSTTDVIYTLTNLIVDYCQPTGFVSKEGRLISGRSDDGDSYWAYTRGQQRWLELAVQPLIDAYMEYNGYSDYTARFKFPSVGRTKAEIMIRQAELGARTRTLTPAEVRARLEAEPLDEAEQMRIAEIWKQILPDPRKLDKDNAMLPTSGLINKEALDRLSPGEAEPILDDLIMQANTDLQKAYQRLNDRCREALRHET